MGVGDSSGALTDRDLGLQAFGGVKKVATLGFHMLKDLPLSGA